MDGIGHCFPVLDPLNTSQPIHLSDIDIPCDSRMYFHSEGFCGIVTYIDPMDKCLDVNPWNDVRIIPVAIQNYTCEDDLTYDTHTIHADDDHDDFFEDDFDEEDEEDEFETQREKRDTDKRKNKNGKGRGNKRNKKGGMDRRNKKSKKDKMSKRNKITGLDDSTMCSIIPDYRSGGKA